MPLLQEMSKLDYLWNQETQKLPITISEKIFSRPFQKFHFFEGWYIPRYLMLWSYDKKYIEFLKKSIERLTASVPVPILALNDEERGRYS